MIMFTEAGLTKLKAADLTEIINLYVKAGYPVEDPEDITTNADKVNWIKEVMHEAEGYPHEVTEADTELLAIEDTAVGDVVIVPFPEPEDQVRDAFIADAAILLADKPEAERTTYLEELTKLDTIELGEVVKKLRADKEQPPAPSNLSKNPLLPPEPKKANGRPRNTVQTPESEQNASNTDGQEQELLEKAIKSGNFVYEGASIIKFNTRIAFGKIRFELFASNGSVFTVEAKDVAKITRYAK